MSIQQIIFIVLLGVVGFLSYRLYASIVHAIMLGKGYDYSGNTNKRLRTMLLVAFGQKKMFQRIVPALLHLCIYVAFLFTQVELIEIIIDGVFGVHRFFAPYLGVLYTIIISFIETLSLLALVSTFVFLYRRNIIKLARFEKPEMTGWPKLDANLILLGELLLVIGIFSMNGADILLQSLDPAHYPDTGTLLISSWLGSVLFGGLDVDTLYIIERCGWWLHIVIVFGFLLYLPISKHLHIMLAFPNTYFSRLYSRGKMSDVPEITKEIKMMMGLVEDDGAMMDAEIPEFGVKDVTGLQWKHILDAYTCTECGRCTSVCPANITGKKLSPRKILMNVRERAEEVYKKIKSGNAEYISKDKKESSEKLNKDNFNDGKSLFDYISREEIHACTSCNACVEACPVMISPLEPILEMRRYEILTESAGPQEWLPMFTSIENTGSVWQLPGNRSDWTKDL